MAYERAMVQRCFLSAALSFLCACGTSSNDSPSGVGGGTPAGMCSAGATVMADFTLSSESSPNCVGSFTSTSLAAMAGDAGADAACPTFASAGGRCTITFSCSPLGIGIGSGSITASDGGLGGSVYADFNFSTGVDEECTYEVAGTY